MASTITSTQNVIKELAKHVGLGDFEVVAGTGPGFGEFVITIGKTTRLPKYKVDIEGSIARSVIDEVFEPIAKSIENSPLVREMKNLLEGKIALLEGEIKQLNLQVDELKPFKTHYDLAFKLEHGNKK